MDPHAPALQLAGALRRKELSPVELLEACLAMVERHNPDLNAIVWRNDDEARREARRWERKFVAGDEHLPLFAGIPVPIKDLTAVAGWPITYGSRGGPPGPSKESAMVVERFRRAGFILCGRTNTPELGTITVTENERYGVTRNPWDLTRSPGGSSGGAAAAVASGMFPLAQGSDGGGSIRIPASCCGLVGLKPSRGRVPSVVAGWLGLVTEGALCRTVADAAAILDCLAGPEPTVWLNAPPAARAFVEEVGADPGRLRVGLLREAPLGITVQQAPQSAVTAAGRLLEQAGHLVDEVEVDLAPVESVAPFIVAVNAGLGDFPEIDWSKVEAHNAFARAAATGADSLTLVRALAELQRISRSQLACWGRDLDLLVTPTLAIEPPAAGSILHALQENPADMPYELLAMAVFTSCFNVTGQPAASIPLSWTESGFPIGVQLAAGAYDEARLLRVASQLEAMSPWADRRPELAVKHPPESRRTTAA